MSKLPLIVIFTSILFVNVNAQTAKYDQNNNMTAIYDIGVDDGLDVEFCSIERFSGTIVAVDEGYPEVTATIRTQKGKKTFSVNTERMSMADRSNFFPSLLKKGKAVKIEAFMCGSGAFFMQEAFKLF